MQNWKTISRQVVLDFSRFLAVERHTVELPDGRIIDDWPWILTPDYVNVVAVGVDSRFLCFRQTKYAVQGTSLAPVGGYLERGEDPLSGAQRELLEETGYTAREWTLLASLPVDGNRGVGRAYFFLATGAHQAAEVYADDLEEQDLLLLTQAELAAALAGGEFKTLPWAACVALALLHLQTTPLGGAARASDGARF